MYVHGAFVPPPGWQVLREDSKFNLKTGCLALAFVELFIISPCYSSSCLFAFASYIVFHKYVDTCLYNFRVPCVAYVTSVQ